MELALFLRIGYMYFMPESSKEKGVQIKICISKECTKVIRVSKIVVTRFLNQCMDKICIKIIRIHHESEGEIEKSVPVIFVWHHKSCRVMTNGDPEGRIFLTQIVSVQKSPNTLKYNIT